MGKCSLFKKVGVLTIQYSCNFQVTEQEILWIIFSCQILQVSWENPIENKWSKSTLAKKGAIDQKTVQPVIPYNE